MKFSSILVFATWIGGWAISTHSETIYRQIMDYSPSQCVYNYNEVFTNLLHRNQGAHISHDQAYEQAEKETDEGQKQFGLAIEKSVINLALNKIVEPLQKAGIYLNLKTLNTLQFEYSGLMELVFSIQTLKGTTLTVTAMQNVVNTTEEEHGIFILMTPGGPYGPDISWKTHSQYTTRNMGWSTGNRFESIEMDSEKNITKTNFCEIKIRNEIFWVVLNSKSGELILQTPGDSSILFTPFQPTFPTISPSTSRRFLSLPSSRRSTR